MIPPAHDRTSQHFLSRAAVALDVVFWLSSLPVLLRIHSLPTLLKRLACSEKGPKRPALELKETVRLVTRVCNLRPFHARPFPKQCLRQALSLYRALIQQGYEVEIHFGVRKEQSIFTGHSWVTMDGQPVGDTTCSAMFTQVYSHASKDAKLRMSSIVI